LKIPKVVFPVAAGVMSALGLLVSPLAFEVARARRGYLSDLEEADFESTFAALAAEASGILAEAGLAPNDIRIVRRLDMRYQGQGHEIEVVLPSGPITVDEVEELFGETYKSIYTLRLDEPAEIINWKLEAIGPTNSLGDHYELDGGDDAGTARKGTRSAYHPTKQKFFEWPVYDRYALRPGMEIKGPALIEERESTCVIGPDDRVVVDARFNLIADLDLEA
ncbi:MAG: hypothetical protein AAGD43_20395, partial [Pseudomonadota bacterium]